MEITGRITADATVRETKNDSKVVGFTIAINDSYRTKDGEQKKITTYVDCSYWRHSGIAQYLTKGTIVLVYGRVGVNAWANKEGKPQASLTCHVNDIHLMGKGNSNYSSTVPTAAVNTATAYTDDKEDLPF